MTHLLLVLAAEGGKKTLWDPTILGLLTVLAGFVLFCGSTYLLLATNLGGRLGFLVSAAALTGIMVLLSALWLTSNTPLNSPKGREPRWTPVSCDGSGATSTTCGSLAEAPIKSLSEIAQDPNFDKVGKAKHSLAEGDYALMRPWFDAAMVQKTVAGGGEAPVQPYAKYSVASAVLTQACFDPTTKDAAVCGRGDAVQTLREFKVGGKTHLLFFHTPNYAAVEYCPAVANPIESNPNATSINPTCDNVAGTRWLILQYDYGSIRLPPLFYLIFSTLLFAISLYALHTRERAQQRMAAVVAA